MAQQSSSRVANFYNDLAQSEILRDKIQTEARIDAILQLIFKRRGSYYNAKELEEFRASVCLARPSGISAGLSLASPNRSMQGE